MKKIYLLIFLVFSVSTVFSQDYSKVDNTVKYYPEHFVSFESLAKQISADFNNEVDQIRALYYWVSNNILYDFDHDLKLNTLVDYNLKDPNYGYLLKKDYAKSCLKRNIGVCEGYSLIIKHTLDVLNIENKIIRGYAKTSIHDIGNITNIKNHAWNAVKINSSWKLIDATWSTGISETNRTNFNFNDYYFLVEPEDFILSHFPDKYDGQFLGYPRSKKDFFYAPIFHNNYYWSKLKLPYNPEGIKKTGNKNKISIIYETIDETKNYFYKFSSEKEHYNLTFKRKNNKYTSSIIYNGNEDTVLTIYETEDPIMSFKVKTD